MKINEEVMTDMNLVRYYLLKLKWYNEKQYSESFNDLTKYIIKIIPNLILIPGTNIIHQLSSN